MIEKRFVVNGIVGVGCLYLIVLFGELKDGVVVNGFLFIVLCYMKDVVVEVYCYDVFFVCDVFVIISFVLCCYLVVFC